MVMLYASVGVKSSNQNIPRKLGILMEIQIFGPSTQTAIQIILTLIITGF